MVQFGGDPFCLVAQMVKNPPIMQETRVQSLGWEDPLEEDMATHFSILAWRIPWTELPGGDQLREGGVGGPDRSGFASWLYLL